MCAAADVQASVRMAGLEPGMEIDVGMVNEVITAYIGERVANALGADTLKKEPLAIAEDRGGTACDPRTDERAFPFPARAMTPSPFWGGA